MDRSNYCGPGRGGSYLKCWRSLVKARDWQTPEANHWAQVTPPLTGSSFSCARRRVAPASNSLNFAGGHALHIFPVSSPRERLSRFSRARLSPMLEPNPYSLDVGCEWWLPSECVRHGGYTKFKRRNVINMTSARLYALLVWCDENGTLSLWPSSQTT